MNISHVHSVFWSISHDFSLQIKKTFFSSVHIMVKISCVTILFIGWLVDKNKLTETRASLNIHISKIFV